MIESTECSETYKETDMNFVASVYATSKEEHIEMMTKFAEEQVKMILTTECNHSFKIYFDGKTMRCIMCELEVDF